MKFKRILTAAAITAALFTMQPAQAAGPECVMFTGGPAVECEFVGEGLPGTYSVRATAWELYHFERINGVDYKSVDYSSAKSSPAAGIITYRRGITYRFKIITGPGSALTTQA